MSKEIPKVQKALVTKNPGPNFSLEVNEKYPVPVPKENELLVKVLYSGVCHTDLSMMTNHWEGFAMHVDVAGHEGVAQVVGYGSKVNKESFPLGTRVGVTLIKSVCLQCEDCLTPGQEVYCDAPDYLTVSANGSFQQYTVVDANYAIKIPEGLPDKFAGPLLCSGVTAYKSIKRAKLQAGNFIVVTGAAGGTGSMAVFFAKCLGLRIIAVDVGEDKKQVCLDNGAEFYIDAQANPDYTAEVHRITKRGAHAVVVFPPSIKVYAQALSVLGKHGTVVAIGIPSLTETLAFPPALSIFRDIRFIGSMLGTRKDTLEALDLALRHNINIPITEYDISETGKILKDLHHGKVIGRAVVKL